MAHSACCPLCRPSRLCAQVSDNPLSVRLTFQHQTGDQLAGTSGEHPWRDSNMAVCCAALVACGCVPATAHAVDGPWLPIPLPAEFYTGETQPSSGMLRMPRPVQRTAVGGKRVASQLAVHACRRALPWRAHPTPHPPPPPALLRSEKVQPVRGLRGAGPLPAVPGGAQLLPPRHAGATEEPPQVRTLLPHVLWHNCVCMAGRVPSAHNSLPRYLPHAGCVFCPPPAMLAPAPPHAATTLCCCACRATSWRTRWVGARWPGMPLLGAPCAGHASCQSSPCSALHTGPFVCSPSMAPTGGREGEAPALPRAGGAAAAAAAHQERAAAGRRGSSRGSSGGRRRGCPRS